MTLLKPGTRITDTLVVDRLQGAVAMRGSRTTGGSVVALARAVAAARLLAEGHRSPASP